MKLYEMPPVDWWRHSVSLKTMFGKKHSKAIKAIVQYIVYEYTKECPHTIRCGMVANDGVCLPIIYAKIYNNGLTYAITEVQLTKLSRDIEYIKTIKNEYLESIFSGNEIDFTKIDKAEVE